MYNKHLPIESQVMSNKKPGTTLGRERICKVCVIIIIMVILFARCVERKAQWQLCGITLKRSTLKTHILAITVEKSQNQEMDLLNTNPKSTQNKNYIPFPVNRLQLPQAPFADQHVGDGVSLTEWLISPSVQGVCLFLYKWDQLYQWHSTLHLNRKGIQLLLIIPGQFKSLTSKRDEK